MFENDFMKMQSSIISTCSEFAQNKADFIFVYLFMRENKYYFNVFFRFGKETWDMGELEYPPETVSYFCGLIKQDAERLSQLYEAEKREKPVMYKMKFRFKDSKFKFELKYDNDFPIDFQPEQAFSEWKQKMKNKSIILL